MAPVERDAAELPALEETRTEPRVLEEGCVKAIQPLPMPPATARVRTIYSPESALSSSACLLPALRARRSIPAEAIVERTHGSLDMAEPALGLPVHPTSMAQTLEVTATGLAMQTLTSRPAE